MIPWEEIDASPDKVLIRDHTISYADMRVDKPAVRVLCPTCRDKTPRRPANTVGAAYFAVDRRLVLRVYFAVVTNVFIPKDNTEPRYVDERLTGVDPAIAWVAGCTAHGAIRLPTVGEIVAATRGKRGATLYGTPVQES